MFVAMALSVRLFVYAGLSLFIISGPYLYMVVCILYAYNLTQQGVIQHPVQIDMQAAGARPRRSTSPMNTQQTASLPNLQTTENRGIRETDRLPEQEGDPNHNDYVLNCIHKSRPLTLNDVGRPVFVNHYYMGEAFIPVTSKKLIKLDECDVSIENSLRNAQPQGIECE